MHIGKTVFAQLMSFVPAHEFHRCVNRYRGDYKVTSFSCWDQFLSMAFAQLTGRESLRDIETCLRALGPKLYHSGFRGPISRSTLADANETRDFRIYADREEVIDRSRATVKPQGQEKERHDSVQKFIFHSGPGSGLRGAGRADAGGGRQIAGAESRARRHRRG